MELTQLLTNPTFWLGAAVVFGAVELFLIPAVGFLFAALGALVCAVALHYVFPEASLVVALSVFAGATVVFAALLWKWMKGLHKSRDANISNMVGEKAEVVGTLTKGKVGQAKWSGTVMRAVLDEESTAETVEEGTMVEITAVHGNTLTVK